MTAVNAVETPERVALHNGFDGPELLATDDRPVVFYAKGTHHRLVRQHGITRPSPDGAGFFEAQESVVVEFAPLGRIEVEPGEQIMRDNKGWLADRQELGRRGLPDDKLAKRDLVTALRSHRGYNVDFFEEGAEPGRPQPTEERFMEMVTEFTLAWDAENLKGLIDTEIATHNRPVLVKSAQGALTRVEAALQSAQGQADDAEASGSK
jgi:hypothetical protein